MKQEYKDYWSLMCSNTRLITLFLMLAATLLIVLASLSNSKGIAVVEAVSIIIVALHLRLLLVYIKLSKEWFWPHEQDRILNAQSENHVGMTLNKFSGSLGILGGGLMIIGLLIKNPLLLGLAGLLAGYFSITFKGLPRYVRWVLFFFATLVICWAFAI
jgi:hypothetical protein